MVFAVIQISDGNFLINSEGYTDLNKARAAYHNLCRLLYSDLPNIKEGFTVILMNSGGGVVEIESYTKPIEEIDGLLTEDIPAEVEEPVEE